MPRRTSSPKPTMNIDKLSIPGVSITELLDLQDILPDLRKNIAGIMLPIVAIAQIRVALSEFKPSIVQGLQSVNLYNRLVLAKSNPLLYVTGAVAIRRTIAAYAADDSGDLISEDLLDLVHNPSGPIITRGGLGNCMDDPDRLRAYRRGIMAKTTGTLQSTPMHAPRRLARDIERITPDEFLSRLPFETSDLGVNEIYNRVNTLISPTGEVISCVEMPTVSKEQVPIESGLLISRRTPVLPDISKIPADTSKLPAWRRAAITQAKNIKGGNS